MTQSDAVLSVDLVTLRREDLFDISRLLARALDPDLLNVAGKPIIVTVNGSHSSGKKIVSDAMFEALWAGRDMIFSGQEGLDEFYFDPFESGLQLSFIDLAYGFGYKTESLQAPGVKSSGHLQEAFLQVCNKQGGLAVLQNNRQDVPGIHIWIEDGIRDPTFNPRAISELGMQGAEDQTAFFTAARTTIADRKWVRRVRLEVSDPRLLQTPQMQYAINTLTQQADEVRRLLLKKRLAADAIPPQPYKPTRKKPRP